MSNYTNFDLLLYAATEEYCDKWVNEILASPVAGEITARERRRFTRIRRKYSMGTDRLTPLKIACVAVLVCMSLAFSACMCIPSIRSAIKNVFVDWYEEFMCVDFKDPDATGSPETETAAPPTSIERKAYVADLPEGYTAEVVSDTNLYYIVQYYYDNEMVFLLSQGLIKRETLRFDSDKQEVEHIILGSYTALLIREIETEDLSIVWQDHEYEYIIKGDFVSKEDVVAIAESVCLN